MATPAQRSCPATALPMLVKKLTSSPSVAYIYVYIYIQTHTSTYIHTYFGCLKTDATH